MLTVHHLQVSQSERIVWLCEELGLEYTLKLHKRAPLLSPQSIKDLHPLGAAPIIQDLDGTLTLAESAACADWIIHKHGDGRLALPPSHPHYADYLYWYHYANGTLQPSISRLMALTLAGCGEENPIVRRMRGKLEGHLQLLEDRLAGGGKPWLAGDEFSAADIMTVFSLTTMRVFYPVDLGAYTRLLAYLRRATEREGYRAARERADPGLDYYIQGPPPQSFVSRL